MNLTVLVGFDWNYWGEGYDAYTCSRDACVGRRILWRDATVAECIVEGHGGQYREFQLLGSFLRSAKAEGPRIRTCCSNSSSVNFSKFLPRRQQ